MKTLTILSVLLLLAACSEPLGPEAKRKPCICDGNVEYIAWDDTCSCADPPGPPYEEGKR